MKKRNRTKEEIALDIKKQQDRVEKMTFVKERFYPALCKATTNIDDATMFLGSINTVMMEMFLGLMKERKMGELNLMTKLDPKSDKFEQLKELLSMFEDMSIFDAKSYFEGMKTEIQLFVNDELKTRPLESLKTLWIDEIKNNAKKA